MITLNYVQAIDFNLNRRQSQEENIFTFPTIVSPQTLINCIHITKISSHIFPPSIPPENFKLVLERLSLKHRGRH